MSDFSFLKPLDQPSGKLRLLDELRTQLQSKAVSEFWIMVAYAKVGPLLRLEGDIAEWKKRGGTIHAVIGIDQTGTSREALEFALLHFDTVLVAHAAADDGSLHPTFHPKLYVFVGKQQAVAFVGSNNLTVGGTETNFEAGTFLRFSLPQNAAKLDELLQSWDEIKAVSVALTPKILDDLVAGGLVIGELEQRRRRKAAADAKNGQAAGGKGKAKQSMFAPFKAEPPSPLPKSAMQARPAKKGAKSPSKSTTQPPVEAAAEALAIQIVPHHNGEVFLSKIAVGQNPSFFGWPFTGKTTPKKLGNAPYPQRTPDPVANIEVFDSKGKRALAVEDYGVNTVYYSEKSEIRITFRPDIVAVSPALSIMVMREAEAGASHDYDISIYAPGSGEYATYLSVCNQAMPSGGSANPRKFGWL